MPPPCPELLQATPWQRASRSVKAADFVKPPHRLRSNPAERSRWNHQESDQPGLTLRFIGARYDHEGGDKEWLWHVLGQDPGLGATGVVEAVGPARDTHRRGRRHVLSEMGLELATMYRSPFTTPAVKCEGRCYPSVRSAQRPCPRTNSSR